MDFSVLMTTYHGEKPEFLRASLESVLVNQTVLPSQMVLVLDGEVGDELNGVVQEFESRFPSVLEVVRCPVNQGQSKASAEGMKFVKYDLVARMDSDDISVPDRFEKQLSIFKENPSLSVVGGWIAEFEQDPDDADSVRIVPQFHEEITSTFKKRMPINNVTAMIKKGAIERAGGYGRDTVNEDYSLYVRMWVNGDTFYNVQETFVKVRTGNGMTARRSDYRIFRDWCKDQKFLRQNKKQSRLTSFVSCARVFVFVVLIPSRVKSFIYKKFLRKKSK